MRPGMRHRCAGRTWPDSDGLVGDDQRRCRVLVDVPGDGLHHADLAQLHVDAVARERLLDLLAQLAPVDEEEDPLAAVGRAFCHVGGDDALAAAARDHDARPPVPFRPCAVDVLDGAELVVS